MGILDKLKKKKEGEEGQPPAESGEQKGANQPPTSVTGLGVELERLKAQFESFKEIRNAFNERFTMISEQLGEMRTMIMQKDKDISELEAKAMMVIDLVQTVQPDKFMVEIKKQDGKGEALKASIESVDAIVKRVLDELKDVRDKMAVFKGMDQVVKMNEEVKNELINIKRIEAVSMGHADKVETIFMEMQKRFKDLDMFKDSLNELSVNMKTVNSDLESIKVRVSESVKKIEVEKIFTQLKKQAEVLAKAAEKSPLAKDLEELKDLLEKIHL